MTAIHTIDLKYLGAANAVASYILIGPPNEPVMIETGPGVTTDALTAGLESLGLTPADVRHVLVTHIHFDHAGASGWMASHGAHIYAHEFGARHLIDPSRLIESATRIYGDKMATLWGELIPIPEQQVTAVHDGDVIEVGGFTIRAIETPGHARHHHAYAMETDAGRICFTGDVAATRIPGADNERFCAIPMPPPEFDLEAWIASIEKLEAERFDFIYPTHFGRVDDPAGHFARVKPGLREHAGMIRAMMDEGLDRDAILERYSAWYIGSAAAAHVPEESMPFFIKESNPSMNVTGIMRYWTKLAERTAAAGRD